MNISDIIVARSGAMTITEISKLGKPAIFVPFPFATENHQEYNARVLEEVGAAKIILDKELTSVNLTKEISKILQNQSKREEMGKNARKKEITNVEDKIYTEILRLTSKNEGR